MNWNDHLFQPVLGAEWNAVRFAVSMAGPISAENPFGLNVGLHVGDSAEQVYARREALSQWIGAPIVWLNQVHETEVLHVNEFLTGTPPVTADASVTTNHEVALAIMTADCLPVLFVARNERGVPVGVAAAHAGWRGLHAGVLERTVHELLAKTSTKPESVSSWLGPCIGPLSFEVGPEVFDAFVESHPEQASCFVQGHSKYDNRLRSSPVSQEKYFGDLRALARMALQRCGVSKVQQSEQDTFTDLNWFSHRRGQQQGAPAGRFATLIRLLP